MKKQAKRVLDINDAKNTVSGVVLNLSKTAADVAGKTKEFALKSEQAIVNTLDQNGNGEIDIEDIIIISLKTPGVKISRSEFLRKELAKNHPSEVIDMVIDSTPALVGIESKEINQIADEVIKFERNCVSGISAVLGAPGGFAMVATIPADIIQYYAYMLRTAQKLLYLYGFPQIDTDETGQKFDSETMNILIICLGIMYGVAGTKNALLLVSKALASGVEKKLINTALTKGTIFPIVKNVMKWFNVNLTKKIFAGFFKKAIPVAGGIIGGGITFLSFKPCCDKLKKSLQDTYLSNPTRQNDNTENLAKTKNLSELQF